MITFPAPSAPGPPRLPDGWPTGSSCRQLCQAGRRVEGAARAGGRHKRPALRPPPAPSLPRGSGSSRSALGRAHGASSMRRLEGGASLALPPWPPGPMPGGAGGGWMGLWAQDAGLTEQPGRRRLRLPPPPIGQPKRPSLGRARPAPQEPQRWGPDQPPGGEDLPGRGGMGIHSGAGPQGKLRVIQRA